MSVFSLPPKLQTKQTWGQLYGCALNLALAEFCTQNEGVTLLITPDLLSAEQLKADLQFFLGATALSKNIQLFPSWETLPYDVFSPHQDIVSDRLACLNDLQNMQHGIAIVAVSTLMHRLSPQSFLNGHRLDLKIGQHLKLETFRQNLQYSGYTNVNQVLEHGEFAVRGSIIDLFPMGTNTPIRIECFDETIDSLRYFDPQTQRTLKKSEHIQLLPAREFPLNETNISTFRRQFREHFTGNPTICPIYESISAGLCPGGIEYYLPLFFEETATLFDYIPALSAIGLVESVHTESNQFWQEINDRFEQRSFDITRPILKPETCFLNPTELFTFINQHHPIQLHQLPVEKKGAKTHFNTKPPEHFPIDRTAPNPMQHLTRAISLPHHRYLLVAESAGRREVWLDLLQQSQLNIKIQSSWQAFLQDPTPIQMLVGPMQQGAELLDAKISIIVEAQLFGESKTKTAQRRQKSIHPDAIIKDLAELQIGAPVVHLQFGIGRYQGLQSIEHLGCMNDYLVLSYADDAKIYVPVTALNVISRYTGADGAHAPLHRLGSDQWTRAKNKALEKIHDVAADLLEIYAEREATPGFTYQFDAVEYQRFASGFPFTETIDQEQAIKAIIADMQSPKPMDRLICGDVGFGKTEVAMRAAFLAVQNGKQVCVLVPTTLLADQHFETFKERFVDFPIRIELLSRFRSTKESTQVIQLLKNGRVDIVIGTHKLFQKDIAFQNLGLLIIDEEHRFGVKQKEHIKSLRTHVDVLSMTATPIPRTLNMAMHGIRDISLIATPPKDRLAIKTFWQEKTNPLVREAILREILRGGQVFFLYNKVQSIERVTTDLQILVPEAKIQYAHGQMSGHELERIMSDFYHHRFNVLVCTTIIETGIDIPTANTIIIDEAQHFGLAQLHQLRGRVGRSHHQAYAYLFTLPEPSLTPDAVKRLKALVASDHLGAGFTLASHDLEIRGAGELLGEGQSGNMHAIGFSLYMELLDEAVQSLKNGIIPKRSIDNPPQLDIDLRISAIIPEDYIGDVHLRLIFYKRIANASNKAALHELQIELIDRFGLFPTAVKHLFLITELKSIAMKLGVVRIGRQDTAINIDFNDNPKLDAAILINLLQTQSQSYQMLGPKRFIIKKIPQDSEQCLLELCVLLKKLQPGSP